MITRATTLSGPRRQLQVPGLAQTRVISIHDLRRQSAAFPIRQVVARAGVSSHEKERMMLKAQVSTLEAQRAEVERKIETSKKLLMDLDKKMAKDGHNSANGHTSNISNNMNDQLTKQMGHDVQDLKFKDLEVSAPDGCVVHVSSATGTIPEVSGLKTVIAVSVCLHEHDSRKPELLWGVSAGSDHAWFEPPEGWATSPPISRDAGKGAWTTEGKYLGAVDSDKGRFNRFSFVLKIPMAGTMAECGGVAFKLQLGPDAWVGNRENGGNLSIGLPDHVKTSSVRPGSAPKGARLSSSARNAKIVVNLSEPRPLPVSTDSLESATNPKSEADAPLAWPEAANTDCINFAKDRESSARRSLMHRYNLAAELLNDSPLPDNSHELSESLGFLKRHALVSQTVTEINKDWLEAAKNNVIAAGRAESQMMVVAAWLRFASARMLVWNDNYNIKPREISAKQDWLTNSLADMWSKHRWAQPTLRVALTAVGRGGQGDMGQRIRDQILEVQQHSGLKGGMLEQWHQKLHNNTSPDDVEICRALLDYIDSGFDTAVYWRTLNEAGIDKARLASFTRSITHDPEFNSGHLPRLRDDLEDYLVTLCAVHGGQDLKSASNAVLGYSQGSVQGKKIDCQPVGAVATPQLKNLIEAALQHQADTNEIARSGETPWLGAASEKLAQHVGVLVQARLLLSGHMNGNLDRLDGRLRDVIYLDLALEGAVRGALEGGLNAFEKDISEALTGLRLACDGFKTGSESGTVPNQQAKQFAGTLVASVDVLIGATENLALSSSDNTQSVVVVQDLHAARSIFASPASQREIWWALHQLVANMERLSASISAQSSRSMMYLAPTVTSLAAALGIETSTAEVLAEDTLRAGPIAPLAQLLAAAEPPVQAALGMSAWRIISPGKAHPAGAVKVFNSLRDALDTDFSEPTILLVNEVGGDEDIPERVVAVIARQGMDVLCHAAVRARATGALVACCTSASLVDTFARDCYDNYARLSLSGNTLEWHVVSREEVARGGDGQNKMGDHGTGNVNLQPMRDNRNRWVIDIKDFAKDVVGGKAVNTAILRERLPKWIGVPPSAAIPFGAFERNLETGENAQIARELEAIREAVAKGYQTAEEVEQSAYDSIMRMTPSNDLRRELEQMVASIADDHIDCGLLLRAIQAVWASKWSSRAIFAARQLRVDHNNITMSVLCQPLIDAKFAFVAHTRDPRPSQDQHPHNPRMYIEAVSNLGESLVSNLSGSALAVTVDKSVLRASIKSVCGGGSTGGGVNVTKFLPTLETTELNQLCSGISIEAAPSKPWTVQPTRHGGDGRHSKFFGMIARSDSNMEDLGEYAGAGVFNSVPTQATEFSAVAMSHSLADFRALQIALVLISAACLEVDDAIEGDQDIEGCLDSQSNIYVVQSRAQL